MKALAACAASQLRSSTRPRLVARIADLSLPRGSVIVAVDHGAGDVVVPNGDTTLQRGDDVIAMIKPDMRLGVCAALVG